MKMLSSLTPQQGAKEMNIKVNVSILKRRPGDIISESDQDFEAFKFWADRKDRKFGMVICACCDDADMAERTEPLPEEKGGVKATEDPPEEEDLSGDNDQPIAETSEKKQKRKSNKKKNGKRNKRKS